MTESEHNYVPYLPGEPGEHIHRCSYSVTQHITFELESLDSVRNRNSSNFKAPLSK